MQPGAHHIQLSAEGYDGVSRSIEIADDGTTCATRHRTVKTPWPLRFGDLEKFAVDYQGKTLQIKQRGGRT
jgi:hypothetical protein